MSEFKSCPVCQEQQAKIDELQKLRGLDEMAISQITHANQQWQLKCDELQKRIGEYEKLTTSIRNEFDLWSDDSEFADVIEAQIENLEALRGASD